MTNNRFFRNFLILSLAAIFQFLFWNELSGINYLVFTLLILPFLYSYNKNSFRKSELITTLVLLLSLSMAILYDASLFSVIMYYFTIVMLIGFVKWEDTKSIVFSFIQSVSSLVISPVVFFYKSNVSKENSKKNNLLKNIFAIYIIPIIIVLIFYIIFYNSNEKFAEYTTKYLGPIQDFVINIFRKITIYSIFFYVNATFLITWILTKNKFINFSKSENNINEIIVRNKSHKTTNFSTIGLKKEYYSSLFLLILINLLVLLENITDIIFIWFNFEFKQEMNLSQFVHEGTYLLILSILLSMLILLYMFRKNQNFYKKSKVLKLLSYLWIFQNLILLISVAVRNFHYIEYYGLAYKRIGVYIFLLMVMYGLLTFIIKILKNKSGYYLLKKNLWCVYFILCISAMFNWDNIITKYNLKYINNPDYEFLVDMSPESLQNINPSKIFIYSKNPYLFHNLYEYKFAYNLQNRFVKNIFEFLYAWETSSSVSWSYCNYKAYQNFINRPDLIKVYNIYKKERSERERIYEK